MWLSPSLNLLRKDWLGNSAFLPEHAVRKITIANGKINNRINIWFGPLLCAGYSIPRPKNDLFNPLFSRAGNPSVLSIGSSPKTFNVPRYFSHTEKISCFTRQFKLLISKLICWSVNLLQNIIGQQLAILTLKQDNRQLLFTYSNWLWQ